jgi:hypothetical protein
MLCVASAALSGARADEIPAICDLRAEPGSNPDEVILKWGTPFFEIPQEGTKTESSYDIRIGSSPLTDGNWDWATSFPGGPPVALYSHVTLDLNTMAATDPDGYRYWDKVTCLADLVYHVAPGVCSPLSNEPIWFEVRRQSNGQLVALSNNAVYTDNAGRATWTSGDITDVSYNNGGELFDCKAIWPGGSFGLFGGGIQQSDTLTATDTFHGYDDQGYPPPPQEWMNCGGVCIKSLDDVDFTFTIPAGTIDEECLAINLAVAVDVPPFNTKDYPVPGAMYAFTLDLGPEQITEIYKHARCHVTYPEYMLEEYGGLGESSLRAYWYDELNMTWQLLEYGETWIDREHHIISFEMAELGLFALAAELDHDHDGLGDFEEIQLELDPFLDDFDGDGVKDGDELWFTKSDPLDGLKKKAKDQHWTVDVSGRTDGQWIAARIVSGSSQSPVSNCAYIGLAITPEYVEMWNGTGIIEGDAAWGDFDGDGDPDLVLCGESAGGLITKTYENQRSTLVHRQDLEGIESTGSGCLAWGDYDSDGDLDLAMAGATTSGRIARIYENDGDGNLTWDQAQALTGVAGAAAAWGDYDWDGDQDLVLTGYDGSQRISILYENDPEGTLSQDTATTLTGLNSGSADWGDWDGDGDLDLVLTGNDGTNRRTIFYENDPVGTLTDDGDHGVIGVVLSDADWGDYDADGDLDLAITGETGSGGPRVARVYENDGDGNMTQVAHILSIYRSSCDWGDIDLDGDLDLALCGYDGSGLSTYLLENTGTGFSGTPFWFPGVREGALCLVDFDLDGDVDFFMCGADWATKYARLYENRGLLTAVEDQHESASMISGRDLLLDNYPNPFNPKTTVRYVIPQAGHVKIKVYGPTGRTVRTLVDSQEYAGAHSVVWNGQDDLGRDVASGVYYYRLEAGERVETRKMVLLE